MDNLKLRSHDKVKLIAAVSGSLLFVAAVSVLYYRYPHNITAYISKLRPPDFLLRQEYTKILTEIIKREVRQDKKGIYSLIYAKGLQCGGVYSYKVKPAQMHIFHDKALVLKFASRYIVTLDVEPKKTAVGTYKNMKVSLTLSLLAEKPYKGKPPLLVSVTDRLTMNYAWKPNCARVTVKPPEPKPYKLPEPPVPGGPDKPQQQDDMTWRKKGIQI